MPHSRARGWRDESELEQLRALLHRVVSAQIIGANGFYRGWNLTDLNRAIEDIRAALGIEPTPLDPQTLRMMEAAKRNGAAIRAPGGES